MSLFFINLVAEEVIKVEKSQRLSIGRISDSLLIRAEMVLLCEGVDFCGGGAVDLDVVAECLAFVFGDFA